jgi:hypothetical protein
MTEFKKYRRTQIAELRPVTAKEIAGGVAALPLNCSVSAVDRSNGSPKAGDMIARNPANHADQWLVEATYFALNFWPME